jgi:hypothetical protein
MKNFKQGLLLATLMITQSTLACTIDGKEGFLPENDFYISAHAKRTGGISQETFNKVIDQAETVYAPIVAQEGGVLSVERNWNDGTVNAYAQQIGSTWKVSMFGGLARHETITADGFALVVCHEIGHHIGGAPKKTSYWSNSWASNEGQADYFATLKCLRKMWIFEDNAAVVNRMEVPETVKAACGKQWTWNLEYNLCVRGAMAGASVSNLFAALRSQPEGSFDTPDPMIVSRTNDNHPAHQCRLDTYFQGALCEVSMNEDVATESEVTGTCHRSLGHTTGVRPLCWFKPSVQ